jgi:adenylate kinase family enzyme
VQLPELVLSGHRTETLASPSVPERILVYGVTGSGKTWLAERISAAKGIPWHAVDDLTWEPDWVPVPEHEQRRRVERIFAEESWVLDTAYGAWLDVALAHAELVIALDFPRWLSLSRLIRRSVARAVDRRPICNGNRESFRHLFSRNSIVIWHFRSFSRKRARMRAWETDPNVPPVLRFTRPRQVEEWLAERPLRLGELLEPPGDPGA